MDSGPGDRLQNLRMGVAQNHGAPGTDEVDVFPVVFIEDSTAFGGTDEAGGSPH